MIRFRLALCAAALTCAAGAASAQGWTSINQRQATLERRIDAGVQRGQLTRREARALRREFRMVALRETKYRRNGLSAWERADLDRRFDRLQARIHDDRHDNQVASGWYGGRGWTDNQGHWMTINQRQEELDRRIDAGIRSGRLTADEAARLRATYHDIARLEARYRRDGLTRKETADLDRRFDGLAANITWERDDAQYSAGYRR